MVSLHSTTPLSLWVQIASFCFTLAGIYSDLLVIRLCLISAYCFLLINAVTGSPLWPSLLYAGNGNHDGNYFFAVDSIVWCVINIYVHGASLVGLIWDELPVKLTDDEAALWRMFYRTGGLSARLFKLIIAKHLTVIEFDNAAGSIIPTENYFYILYKGCVRLRVYRNDVLKMDRLLHSGEMFDMKHLGMFDPVKSVFSRNRIECQTVTANTKLFRFQRQDMKTIAKHPLAKGVWQSLLINNMSIVVERQYQLLKQQKEKLQLQSETLQNNQESTENQTTANDRQQWQQQQQQLDNGGQVGLDDTSTTVEVFSSLFKPLEPWEMPERSLPGSEAAFRNPFLHIILSAWRSLCLPWPLGQAGCQSGIRQTLLPPPRSRPANRTACGDAAKRPMASTASSPSRWDHYRQGTPIAIREPTLEEESSMFPSFPHQNSILFGRSCSFLGTPDAMTTDRETPLSSTVLMYKAGISDADAPSDEETATFSMEASGAERASTMAE